MTKRITCVILLMTCGHVILLLGSTQWQNTKKARGFLSGNAKSSCVQTYDGGALRQLQSVRINMQTQVLFYNS